MIYKMIKRERQSEDEYGFHGWLKGGIDLASWCN